MLGKWGMINTYWSLILRLDNASEFRIITRIMIPIARSTVVTLAMLTFVSTWNDYFWPMVLTTSDVVRTLPVRRI